MRLLLITDTYPPDINGVARTLSTLGEGLAGLGHQVEVVTTLDAAQGTVDELKRHVMSSIPLPGYPGLRLGFASTRQMQSLMEVFKPDVLYVATETLLGIAAIRAAGRLSVPVVSGFHTNFQTYLEEYHLPGLETVAQGVLRSIHNQTARTLTPSTGTARMLESWGIRNVGVLGRGVDTQLFSPEKRSAELRRFWKADAGTPVAIYVGRMAAEKNLPLAVRAFEVFRQRHPGAPCVFVGDGPRLKAMEEEHPGFIYAGLRTGDDLAAHYASADVFIFPSTTETFGNVVLEAMASGLIPLAYDYAAPHLLIKPGTNGWLAPLDDEAAFLQTTFKLAEDPFSPGMKAAAREAVLDFSWKRVIEQFEGEMLAACGHAVPPASKPTSPSRA